MKNTALARTATQLCAPPPSSRLTTVWLASTSMRVYATGEHVALSSSGSGSGHARGQARCGSWTACALARGLHATPAWRFDIRKHEMEKRRLRELEKAGIDPDDDEPWVAPEEQQRLDEEEEARLAEAEERRQQFLAKRAEEDAVKRKKFKEFRARQVAMSRQRKEAAAESKAAARESARGTPPAAAAADERPHRGAGAADAADETDLQSPADDALPR